jgi:hypothetical protein
MHAATATLTSEEDSRARDALDARGLEGSASTGRQRSSETPRRRTSRSAARRTPGGPTASRGSEDMLGHEAKIGCGTGLTYTPGRVSRRSTCRTERGAPGVLPLGGHVGGRQHGAATGRAARVLAGAAGESEDDYSDVSGCARSQARRFAL